MSRSYAVDHARVAASRSSQPRATSRPRAPRAARRAGSASSSSTASAVAAGSPGGTSTPPPSASRPGSPPTAGAITGMPAAIASCTTRARASHVLVSTKRSAASSRSSGALTGPRKSTGLPKVAACSRRSASRSATPEPATSHRTRVRSWAAAATRVGRSFCGAIREIVTIQGRSPGRPYAVRTRSRAPARCSGPAPASAGTRGEGTGASWVCPAPKLRAAATRSSLAPVTSSARPKAARSARSTAARAGPGTAGSSLCRLMTSGTPPRRRRPSAAPATMPA